MVNKKSLVESDQPSLSAVPSTSQHPLHTSFFERAVDIREWLRLFDYLPNVYLFIKNRDGQFVGGNQAHLSRSFKKRIGVSPRQFRARGEQDPA